MKILIMSILSFLSSAANATPEQKFWRWFQKNEAVIFDFEQDQENIFDQFAAEMQKVNPSLTFEFGPKVNGKREFIISADGIKDAFPQVESLYLTAPTNLTKWVVIKYRPRREPFDIEYGGVSVNAESVNVILQPGSKKIDITLVIPGYTDANSNLYIGIAYLILDQALGEYDVETKAGLIQVKSSAPPGGKLLSLHQLPKEFDSALD